MSTARWAPAPLAPVAFLAFAAAMPSCLTLDATTAQPTAVERQLLGAYDELDEALVRASSVRGVSGWTLDGMGAGALPSPETYASVQSLALSARALQQFNEDDLLALKAEGCVVEALGAMVKARACAKVREDPAVARRLKRVVEEENRCRAAVVRWAAYEVARRRGRAEVSSAIRDEVRDAYRRLLLETAKPGTLIERAPGRIESVSK
ncbi:MAG: hypothetical protein IPK13_24880 [Deltaproteobacteria bacterium]|nr:hypothetical protein [Deltaproteobacteria bacterium]